MALRIRLGDVVIEADSASDLQTALSVVNKMKPQHKQETAAPPPAPAATPTMPMLFPPKGPVRQHMNLLRRLHGRGDRADGQLKVLRELAGAPNGLTDGELRKHLEYDDNSQLSGPMSGISKNCKAVGLPYEEVIRREKLDGGGYHYSLTPEMQEAVEADQGE